MHRYIPYLIGVVLALVALSWILVGVYSLVDPICRDGESLVRSEDDGLVCVRSRAP